MTGLTIVEHPLVQHKLALLRDKSTTKKDFRALVGELTVFLMVAATCDLELNDVTVETPLMPCACRQLVRPDPYIFQILRAGQGMMDAALSMIPTARIGASGIYRNEETLEAVSYFHKPQKITGPCDVFVVDPMLATAHTATKAITDIKNSADECLHIRMLAIIAAPEGVAALQAAHPDVEIFTCALDQQLNEKGYILPGLGDAGDRLFGTL